jgi:hypothetical protein
MRDGTMKVVALAKSQITSQCAPYGALVPVRKCGCDAR